MGRRTAIGTMESTNYAQQIHRLHTIFMVYGADAVLPAEVRHNAPRVAAYKEADSNRAMEDAVDLLDEARDTTLARTVVYQQGLCNYHAR